MVSGGLPEWIKELRKSQVTERVKHDPRSTDNTFLGLNHTAVLNAISWGQAAFDQPFEGLSPEDRVLLYAYFNQLGHLEELTAAFRMLFATKPLEEAIVIDLGCGPFTGGLAFAGALEACARFDYIGMDKSYAMRTFGEQLASVAGDFDGAPKIDRNWVADISSVSWVSAPGWRPVIVIVSYLLASPSLDAVALIGQLEELLVKLGRGPVTVLYTNSKYPWANSRFPDFCEALHDRGFNLYADDTGEIDIDRWDGPRRREFRYALFHRQQQKILQLGED